MPAAFATSVPSSLLTLSSFGFCERPTSWFSPASQSPYLLSPLFRLLSLWVQVIHPKLSPFLPPHTLPGVTGTLPLLWGCLLIPLPTSQMLTAPLSAGTPKPLQTQQVQLNSASSCPSVFLLLDSPSSRMAHIRNFQQIHIVM